ncbi:MAG: acyl-[acyl-carrier-protein]--UDP-N-acetylglucosamine O-acyltransferase, partial [Planctomycetota bacterium]|nr:acyl-[acyl-carrier-protein]--UDP-N-acetylglucosamine O-acyltransferase [Planctomycetota bacterium]
MDLTVISEIADGAKIAPDVRIGQCCVIGPDVVVESGTVLGCRVTVAGRTTIGADNVIQDGCVLGVVPQDLKYHGRPTYLVIGDLNRFGPNVTAHVGTEEGGGLTRIGDDNVLEAGAHIAHDCFVDDRTHIGPAVLLAGHIRVETGAVLDEIVGVHHFTTIGRFSRVGARTPVTHDVPPFVFFASDGYYNSPPAVKGIHEQGLEAANLSPSDAGDVRQAFRRLFEDKRGRIVKVRELLAQTDQVEPVRILCESCMRSLTGRFGRHRE